MKAKNLLKKAFLLLALVGGATSAWADVNTTLIDGIILPSTPTTSYNLSTGNVVWSGTGASTKYLIKLDANGNGIMQASAGGYGSTSATRTFANAATSTTDGSWSTTGVTWETTVGYIFLGSSAYTTSSNDTYVNFARRGNLQTGRTFAFRFTGAGGFSALVKSNGNTDATAAVLAVYELNTSTGVLTSAGSASSKAKAVDVVTVDGLSKFKTYVAFIYGMSGGNGDLYEIAFLAPPAKTISTQGLKSSGAVKVGETTLTLNAGSAGYSVSGTTITLTDDQQSAATPANVKLVNHIVYTDETTEDDDVDVSFDGTVTDGYYVGTATIDETDYTIKMKKDVTPSFEATVASLTMSSPRMNGDTKVFTLTGANLTGEASCLVLK